MSDSTNALVKAISREQDAVVYVLDATALVQESMNRLEAWPPATKHLGQAMMSALLLQALGDSEGAETVSLQWMCAGPFGHCFAEARNFGEVRGTISHPRAEGVADYATPLGEGVLQVRRSRGGPGTTSVVNAAGEVTLDLVEYLEQSEQKNCGINLSVVVDWADAAKTQFRVSSALGYLVHVLPQPTEAQLNESLLRWNGQMEALGPISRWALTEGFETRDMLRLLLSEEAPQVVMNQRVLFSCNCSEERAARALALLETQEEKEGSFLAEEETEIRCEFCGKTYQVKHSLAEKWKGKGSQ